MSGLLGALSINISEIWEDRIVQQDRHIGWYCMTSATPCTLSPSHLHPITIIPAPYHHHTLYPITITPCTLSPSHLHPITITPCTLSPSHLVPYHHHTCTLSPSHLVPYHHHTLYATIGTHPQREAPHIHTYQYTFSCNTANIPEGRPTVIHPLLLTEPHPPPPHTHTQL